jgi:predicted nucleic acid-binding protein
MIAFDSNVLIYFLEKNPSFFEAAKRLFLPVLAGDAFACTSVLTITEIVAGSSATTNLEILAHPNITVLGADNEIAHGAGALRLRHPRLKTPDAVHLATAMHAGAKVFYTNDKPLIKLGRVGTLPILPLA